MNHTTKKRQLLSWAVKGPALAAIFFAAGCAPMKPFIYKPNGPITTEPPKFSAAVALVDNESPPVAEYKDNEPGLFRNFSTHKYYTHMSPQKMTNHLIEDLSNSGLFSFVSSEGEGDADIIIKPTYRKAEVKQTGDISTTEDWNFDMEIEVLRGKESLMKKLYTSKWEIKYNAFAYNGLYPQVAARLSGLMDEIRKDLAELLKGLKK